MTIVTIGSAMRDIFISWCHTQSIERITDTGPRQFLLVPEGDKIEVDNLIYSTGGGATNAAASFVRQEIITHAFFSVGDDATGTNVIQELESYGINCSAAQRVKNIRTGTSFVIPCPSGDRSIFVYRGANLKLNEKNIPWKLLENASLVYITSLSEETALLSPIITRFAQQHNIPIATNPGSSQLKEHAASLRDCLNALDILILNAQEAAQLLSTITPDQPFDLTRYMKTILGKGVRIVAVTKDIDGVWVAYNDTLYYHPSISVEIASTIGAGDAFGSAFTASIAQNYSIEESLVRGIINASSVIGSYDAKSGLLSKKELDDRMKKLGTTNISKSSLKNR